MEEIENIDEARRRAETVNSAVLVLFLTEVLGRPNSDSVGWGAPPMKPESSTGNHVIWLTPQEAVQVPLDHTSDFAEAMCDAIRAAGRVVDATERGFLDTEEHFIEYLLTRQESAGGMEPGWKPGGAYHPGTDSTE